MAELDWQGWLTLGVIVSILLALLRGIAPEEARGNPEGILQAAQAVSVEVLLIGLQAPANYGPEYQAAFNAMYPELAQAYDALHVESFLGGLGQVVDEGGVFGLARYMQADGIHPNAEGVALIVEALGPEVEQLIERAASE